MKNKLLLSIFTLCLLFQGVNAQHNIQQGQIMSTDAATSSEEQALIGACSWKLQKEGMSFYGNPFSFGKGTFSAAIMLTKDKFKGGKIHAVRIGLGVEGEKYQIFLSKELNEEPFYTQEVEATSQKGWNYVVLNTPQELTEGPTYIGYTIEANGADNPWGFEDKRYNVYADWRKEGDAEWLHFSAFGIRGSNAIQAVVREGNFSEMPQSDVSVASIKKDASEIIYTKPGTTSVFKIEVTNFGVKALTSLDVTYKFGEKTHTETISGMSVACGLSTVVNVNIPFGDDDEGEHEVEISVSNPNNVEDIDPSDNKIFLVVDCFADTFERKILLEQYTGQACGFCPAGEAELKKAISGMEDRIARVAHHTYSQDAFTINQSLDYASFFGVTGAPVASIDRTANELCTSGITFGTYRDIPRDLISASLSIPALVSIILKGEFNEQTRELDLTVSGRFVKELQYAKLNVFLTEDHLIAKQDGGGDNYEHNSVIRTVLSSVFGDDLEIDVDGNYSKTYKYIVPEKVGAFSCIPSNMNVVAFIADYKNADKMACVVHNSEKSLLTDIGSGIGNIGLSNISVLSQNGIVYIGGEYSEASVYTPNGELVKKVKNESSFGLEDGIYIIKLVNEESSFVKKTVVSK